MNQNLLIGLDCTGAYLWNSLTADITVVVLAWSLTPWLGIAGVAIAYLVANSLLFALTAHILRIRHRMAIVKEVGWLPLYVVVALSIGAATATWLDLPLALLLPLRLILWVGLSLPLLFANSCSGPLLSRRVSCYRPLLSVDRLPETKAEASEPVTATAH